MQVRTSENALLTFPINRLQKADCNPIDKRPVTTLRDGEGRDGTISHVHVRNTSICLSTCLTAFVGRRYCCID